MSSPHVVIYVVIQRTAEVPIFDGRASSQAAPVALKTRPYVAPTIVAARLTLQLTLRSNSSPFEVMVRVLARAGAI